MKYVSIDLETTGLDSEKNQVLEFGAIIEDTENTLSYEDIPKISLIIKRNEINGQVVALDMNQRLISILSEFLKAPKGELKESIREEYNIINENELTGIVLGWMAPHFGKEEIDSNGRKSFSNKFVINIAGKNFASFDAKFLAKIPGWNETFRFRTRIIDPAILFVDWVKDEELPGLDKCLKRAGIEKTVTHKALDDAWDVIQVLRTKYSTNNF